LSKEQLLRPREHFPTEVQVRKLVDTATQHDAESQRSAIILGFPNQTLAQNDMPEKHDPGTYLVFANALIPRDCDTAEKVLRDGMQRFPLARGFHLLLGRVHESRGSDAEAFYEYHWELLRTGAERPEGADAAKCCANVMKKSPVSRELSNFINAVGEMQTNPQNARKRLNQIVCIYGERFVVKLYMAEATQSAGDITGAAQIYDELIQIDPGFVPAYVQLSDVLAASGSASRAEVLLKKACEIDPDHWRLKTQP
jgi:tetratricopeptide (TPR) repeat protein